VAATAETIDDEAAVAQAGRAIGGGKR